MHHNVRAMSSYLHLIDPNGTYRVKDYGHVTSDEYRDIGIVGSDDGSEIPFLWFWCDILACRPCKSVRIVI
jgi:hypothetical protein